MMTHIDLSSKDGRYIKLSDDETHQDIGIYCDNMDQTRELVIEIITKILKGE